MEQGRILRVLKDATAERHEAVERRVDIEGRLGSTSDYADLLARFYGFYAPLESALARAGDYDSLGIDFDERRKTGRLARDLAALGRDPAAVPLCPDPPTVESVAQALGTMYVLEGATLGGRVITRMVESRLGLTPERGCAFFSSYGDRVGAMWNAFRAALTNFATPQTESEVVAAATRTFDALDGWLAAGTEVAR
jgi:heme oxygenase